MSPFTVKLLTSTGFKPMCYNIRVHVTSHYTEYYRDLKFKSLNLRNTTYLNILCNGNRRYDEY